MYPQDFPDSPFTKIRSGTLSVLTRSIGMTRRSAQPVRAIVRSLCALIASLVLAWAGPARAGCVARDAVQYNLGTWTSGQTAKGLPSDLTASAGLRCSRPLLSLIGSNTVTARVHSDNGFHLVSGGGQRISYVASATPDGTRPVAQDGRIEYGDRTLLGLLGLGGRTEADLPISFVSFRGHGLRSGTYRDTIVVDWWWRVCDGVNLLNLICLFHQQGTARTTILLTMNVVERSPTIDITAVVVQDPIRGTTDPLAIPGAQRLTRIRINNPDVVPIDENSLAVAVPIDPRLRLAQTPVAGQRSMYDLEKTPDSGMSLLYSAPGSTTDDVDFSSDAGATWTAVPQPDGSGVNSVRLRMKGSLRPGETVTIQMGYIIL